MTVEKEGVSIIRNVVEGTSTGAGLSLWLPLLKQDQARDLHGTRPKVVISTSASTSWWHPREQAQASDHPWSRPETDLHRTRPKGATSVRVAPSQCPPREKAQAIHLHRTSIELESSAGGGQSQRSLWEKAWTTFWITEQLWGGPSNHQEHRVNETMVLNPPWGTIICALDPVAPGRLITREIATTTPIRRKDG